MNRKGCSKIASFFKVKPTYTGMQRSFTIVLFLVIVLNGNLFIICLFRNLRCLLRFRRRLLFLQGFGTLLRTVRHIHASISSISSLPDTLCTYGTKDMVGRSPPALASKAAIAFEADPVVALAIPSALPLVAPERAAAARAAR